ncbi:MAG: (2Fe-2S)-binding protein [Xanthomonadales bacterium]|jgi:bacterioferritin-associated ferredoxin|nr:(2Fe-2S)-binding protein [Xanthomonadales bacterium]
MYVCLCHGVTDKAIREAAQSGVESLDELSATTGCGSSCGCCKALALEILDAHRCPFPMVA